MTTGFEMNDSFSLFIRVQDIYNISPGRLTRRNPEHLAESHPELIVAQGVENRINSRVDVPEPNAQHRDFARNAIRTECNHQKHDTVRQPKYQKG